MNRPVAGFLAMLLVGSCTTVEPSPSVSSQPPTSGPSAPPQSAAPTAPPATLPPLPTQSAAHLQWVKTKTNLPPRVAHTGFKLAVRPGNPPLYVLIDAFQEVWTSTDGADWTMRRKLEHVTVNIDSTNQVLWFGDRFIALDQDWFYPADEFRGPYSGVTAGLTWSSADGKTWSHAASPVALRSAVVDGDRLAGIGGTTGQFRPTFATSADGATWSAAPLEGDLWPPSATNQGWYSVYGLAGNRVDGFVVSADQSGTGGTVCNGPTIEPPLPTPPGYASPVPILWRSTDLASWTPVASATIGCGRVLDVVHGPRGFVAVGSGPGATAESPMRAWFSRDGIDWHDVPQPPVFDGYLWGTQLAIAPDGTFLHFADEIWESTDGDHWFLSAPATNIYVGELAGDLALGCDRASTCFALLIQP